jgi:hypothetical protein
MKVVTQKFRQGENELPVRDLGQDFLLHPFAVDQHAFLVTGGTEVTGFTGEGQQVIVTAIIVVNPPLQGKDQL